MTTNMTPGQLADADQAIARAREAILGLAHTYDGWPTAEATRALAADLAETLDDRGLTTTLAALAIAEARRTP